MRMKLLDRVLVFIAGFLLLLMGLLLLIVGLGICPIKLDPAYLEGQFTSGQRAIVIAVSLVVIFFGLYSAMLLFRSKREKGFIMQHTEFGDMSISMHALESMVKKVVDTHEELKVTSTSIHNTRDGIVIDIRILLASGVNIPLTVNALQKQIKHYITSCSGVDVKEIRVMIETNHQLQKDKDDAIFDMLKADATAATEAASVADAITESAQSYASEPEEKKEEKQSLHQRLFSHEDTPQIVPAPPQPEADASAEGDDAANDEPPKERQAEQDDQTIAKEDGSDGTESE